MLSDNAIRYYKSPIIMQLIFNACRNRYVFWKDRKGQQAKRNDPQNVVVKHKPVIKIWKRDLISQFIDQFKMQMYDYDFFHSVAYMDPVNWAEFPNTEKYTGELRGSRAGEFYIKREYKEMFDREFPNLYAGWDLIFDVDINTQEDLDFTQAIKKVHKEKAIPLYNLLKKNGVPFVVNPSGSKGFRFTVLWEDLEKAGWDLKQSQQLSVNIAYNLSMELSSGQDGNFLDRFCDYNIQTSVIRAWYSINSKQSEIVCFPLDESQFLVNDFNIMTYHVKNIFNVGKLMNRPLPKTEGSVDQLKSFLQKYSKDSGIKIVASQKGNLAPKRSQDLTKEKTALVKEFMDQNELLNPEESEKLKDARSSSELSALKKSITERISEKRTEPQLTEKFDIKKELKKLQKEWDRVGEQNYTEDGYFSIPSSDESLLLDHLNNIISNLKNNSDANTSEILKELESITLTHVFDEYLEQASKIENIAKSLK